MAKGGDGRVKHGKTAPCSGRSGQGGAAKLSNNNFFVQLPSFMNTGAGWMKNSPVRGMFPDVG
jgi:hypothetical protein